MFIQNSRYRIPDKDGRETNDRQINNKRGNMKKLTQNRGKHEQ